jgi:hypothetical protein
MPSLNIRATLLGVGALFAISACNSATGGMPPAAGANATASVADGLPAPNDTTSILKKLTKDVVIGSTVDATNGDTAPRAVTVVQSNYAKLKKNQILVCNFADSSGNAGKGTTIEQFNPTPNSKPTTFAQSSKIEGCNGSAITSGDQIYASGMTSKVLEWINQNAQLKKTYGSPITQPLSDADIPRLYLYSPEYVLTGNADTGAIDSLSLGGYGTGKVLQIINGFDVNKGSGSSALGPSGFAYWCGVPPGYPKYCKNHADLLYVADGACNTIVQITHLSSLLVKDEITVQPGCKKFTCKFPKTSCGKVVKSGSPLNAPFAETMLPNGNIIVANTKGGNTLVELTQTGQVLATKVVDTGKTPAIFGLASIGTNDGNTALYYTDTNDNSLHELEQ